MVFPHLWARVRMGRGIPHSKDSLSLLMVQYSKDSQALTKLYFQVPQFVKDQYNRPMPGYPADVQVPPQPQLKSSDDAAADRDGANEFIASLVSMQQSLAQSQTEAIKKEIEEKANRRKKLKAKRKRKTAAAAAVGKGEKEEGKRDVKVNGEVSAAIDDERMDDDSEDTDSECR
jgi:hypothetical protein